MWPHWRVTDRHPTWWSHSGMMHCIRPFVPSHSVVILAAINIQPFLSSFTSQLHTKFILKWKTQTLFTEMNLKLFFRQRFVEYFPCLAECWAVRAQSARDMLPVFEVLTVCWGRNITQRRDKTAQYLLLRRESKVQCSRLKRLSWKPAPAASSMGQATITSYLYGNNCHRVPLLLSLPSCKSVFNTAARVSSQRLVGVCPSFAQNPPVAPVSPRLNAESSWGLSENHPSPPPAALCPQPHCAPLCRVCRSHIHPLMFFKLTRVFTLWGPGTVPSAGELWTGQGPSYFLQVSTTCYILHRASLTHHRNYSCTWKLPRLASLFLFALSTIRRSCCYLPPTVTGYFIH